MIKTDPSVFKPKSKNTEHTAEDKKFILALAFSSRHSWAMRMRSAITKVAMQTTLNDAVETDVIKMSNNSAVSWSLDFING